MIKQCFLVTFLLVAIAGCAAVGRQKDESGADDRTRLQQERAEQAFDDLDQEIDGPIPERKSAGAGSADSKTVKSDDLKTTISESITEDYSSSRYLTATGIGQTDAEARRNSKAELSGIFESKIQSEVISSTKSVTGTKAGENFQKKVEANIRVITAMGLKGVKIGKTWYDEKSRSYYAEAVLDRYKARDEWNREIKKQNSFIEAEYKSLLGTKSPILKLKMIKKIMDLWVDKEVLGSRLRVIGFTDKSSETDKMQSVIEMTPEIKSSMIIYVDIAGSYSDEVVDEITERLTKEGFQLSGVKQKSDVMISGDVKIKPVNINNPDYKFARVNLALDIIDLSTGSKVGKVSQKVRKGHVTYTEAEHKAVKKVSKAVSEEIIKHFGI